MTLSENEQKALELSRQGYSSSGIASVIGVTEGTARKYLTSIEQEMGGDVLVDY